MQYYKDVIAAIEETAIPALAAHWDKSGIQVAASRSRVAKMGVFLDATPDNINRALQAGADCLLSHHPISLNPVLPARLDCWHEVLRLLLCANVPLYAAHTSLDVNPAGPAGWLGRALKLLDPMPIEPVGPPNSGYGYGVVGNLPEEFEVKALLEQVLSLANLEEACLCGPQMPGTIRRIAYCGGSGSSMIGLAEASGAELFITGDMKYHQALEAQIPVLDVGHHSLEEVMMEHFTRLLQLRLPDMNIFFVPTAAPFRRVVRKAGE